MLLREAAKKVHYYYIAKIGTTELRLTLGGVDVDMSVYEAVELCDELSEKIKEMRD